MLVCSSTLTDLIASAKVGIMFTIVAVSLTHGRIRLKLTRRSTPSLELGLLFLILFSLMLRFAIQ